MNNIWPDWHDDGKRVEIIRDDDSVVIGKLIIEDFSQDGEGEEIPYFVVKDESGSLHSFAEHKSWRFLP